MRDPAIEQKVIKIAQELIDDDRSDLSAGAIKVAVDRALQLHKAWADQIDREVVVAELIRRFSLWIGQSVTLKSDEGHQAWLNAQRKANWRYWQRYREFLEKKNSERSVEALDDVTDQILGLLEDPLDESGWDRRGLVVGHVQSGKTSNYTGLICKAADAGYKMIVVLAGVHNNLRSQTQMRLDEGFLGYETSPDPEKLKMIGVGEIDGDPKIRPNFLTNRSNKGDFNTAVADKLGITPEQRPWLFVVKKNKTVLERLNRWIRNHVANSQDPKTGVAQVTNLPILVIDDEADHASVDTGADVVDENGIPDEEHQPKIINALIRRLLASFSRSAYVGYTATPFANIFIHEKGRTKEEGPDLFPSAFIINLAAPSNYIGPVRVFGTPSENGRANAMPVVRPIKDSVSEDGKSGWMPPTHKNGHFPRLADGLAAIPESLKTAIEAFLLSCTIRTLRGQGSDHCSMLIHVTRFTSVQGYVYDQVEEYLRQIRQRITRRLDDGDVLERLRTQYERDFLPTSASIRQSDPELEAPPDFTWDEVRDAMPLTIADIDVRRINGTAKDALDYADTKGPGLKVIAIGGDKLSRGLTLEGLCVSYFLRSSKMYDTLMQMGRWFGYRPGYADLCRLWCPDELKTWFEHITDASEELREEFDAMADSGATPREFGLKVQSHSVLMVTSPLKMRTSRTLMLSFSGQLVETVSLPTDKTILEANYEAAQRLVGKLGSSGTTFRQERNGASTEWNAALWRDVPGELVVDFLRSYRTSPKALKVRSPLLADFIQTMMKEGELRSWTVAIPGSGSTVDAADKLFPGVGMIKRTTTNQTDDDAYRIGRLVSPRDEAIDLEDADWKIALETTRNAWHADPARQKRQQVAPDEPNGPGIRKARELAGLREGRSRGLLLLYPIDPQQSDHAKLKQSGVEAVMGISLSFPVSKSGATVPYEVTNVYWEQEYGASE